MNSTRKEKIAAFFKEHREDVLWFTVLFLIALVFTFILSGQMNALVYDWETFNSWFEADTPRYFENYTNRESDFTRTEVHPIFPLMTYFPVLVLRKVLGLTPWLAVRVFDSLIAGVWIGMLYTVFRAINLQKFEAGLFSLLGLVSSAGMFFLTVPEMYPLGSIAMLAALLLVALAESRTVSPAWFTFASALTLGTTVTNWMAGVLAAWSRYTWKTAVQISSNAFSIVVVLWAAQKYFFANSVFFLGGVAAVQRETGFIDFARSGGPLTSAKAFLFHSMVMPEIQIINMSKKAPWLEMSVQQSAPGSAGWLGLVAVVAWLILLTIGISTLFNLKGQEKFRLTLGLLLAGQFGLHLFYGNETLLYSLHYLPMLLLPAALGTQTKWRTLVLISAGVLLVTGLLNNLQQFQYAMDFFDLALGAP